MTKPNIIVDKSYRFGLRTVKLYIHLRKKKIERELLLQFLRCGTSIGANVEEAEGGQSNKDFISKMSIAYKEARETNYWLRIFKDSELLETKLANSFITDADELMKILSSIIKTSKENGESLRLKNS
jgi:four helix bundle protein